MAINIFRYNNILENDTKDFRIGKLRTTVPSPTETDYKIGYIQRYFIQKINDEGSYIYEVTKHYFNSIVSVYNNNSLDISNMCGKFVLRLNLLNR